MRFFVLGDKVYIGDKVYFKEHLQRDVPKNVVGLVRYDKRTGKSEFYNPHKEPFKREGF